MHSREVHRICAVVLTVALAAALPGAAQGNAPAPSRLSAQVVVRLVGLSFDPTPVEIDPGGTVEWQNMGGFHNVVADDGSFTSGPPSDAWTSFSHAFTAPGIYAYHCAIHGAAGGVGMAGVVIVRDPAATQKVYLPLIGT